MGFNGASAMPVSEETDNSSSKKSDIQLSYSHLHSASAIVSPDPAGRGSPEAGNIHLSAAKMSSIPRFETAIRLWLPEQCPVARSARP